MGSKTLLTVIIAVVAGLAGGAVLGIVLARHDLVPGLGEVVHAEDADDHAREDQHEEDDHEGHNREADHEDHGDPDDGHGSEDEQAHEAGEEVIHITKEVMDEFGVKVAAAEPGELKFDLSLPGEVVVNPDRVVHIVPRVPSVAQKVTKTIGDLVEEGELLAVVESAELAEAKTEYLANLKALELARIDLERQQTVHDNTEKMLALLKQSPTLEALSGLESLDLGTHRGELLPAYAEHVSAQAEYKRQQSLRKDKISSEANVQTAQSRYEQGWAQYLSIRDEMAFQNRRTLDGRRRASEVAQFQLNSAKQRLHTLGLLPQQIDQIPDGSDIPLSHLEMRTPIGGTIIERHITKGEKLAGDATAFVIADLSEVWVHLTVYQKDLARVRRGQPVTIALVHDVPDAQGTIDYVSPIVEEETRTATARVVLENSQGHWRPGVFVDAHVQIGKVQVPIRVPTTALQTVHEETVVFVESEEGFRPQHVKVGRSNGIYVEIIEGLEPGQGYAIENAFTLKAELGKGSFGAHHH